MQLDPPQLWRLVPVHGALRQVSRSKYLKVSVPFDGGAPLFSTRRVSAVVVIAASLMLAQVKPAGDTDVTRATLDNGLRVVIVRDPLAPVVTVEQNYLVGGNETP